MKKLRAINNELKSYINEASFISIKCRNKLIKLLGETYAIELPVENYVNIDVQLTEDGNIVMRGDTYKAPNNLTIEEIYKKYDEFQEKAELLIKKKEANYYTKNNINNTLNIFIVIFLSMLYIVVLIFAIKAVLSLRLFTASILFTILSSMLLPNIKNRYEQAKNFIKRKLKK